MHVKWICFRCPSDLMRDVVQNRVSLYEVRVLLELESPGLPGDRLARHLAK